MIGSEEPADVATFEFPLSYQQQRLLLQAEIDPTGSAAYHMPIVVRLRGDLDAEALHQALQSVVDDHEALRTTYPAGAGIQVVAATATLDLERLTVIGRCSPEQVVTGHIAEFLARPFDLGRDLPFRAMLISHTPEDHLLALVAHHISCDGWSLRLLAHQLFVGYAELAAGRSIATTSEHLDYPDFAEWQQRSAMPRLTIGHDFWRRELADAPPFLDLPLDHPRLRLNQPAGRVVIAADNALADAVDAVADRHRVSGFVVVLTAYAWVLGELARSGDVLVGAPTAGRPRPEMADIVGCFFDMIVLRPRLGRDVTVGEALRRAKRAHLAAMANADVPFQHIAEAAGHPRDPLRSPIFQAMLNYQDRPPVLPEVEGITLEVIETLPVVAKYDVSLEVHRTASGMRVELDHDAGLFTQATADRLLRRIVRLLHWMATADDDHFLAEGTAPSHAELRHQSAQLAGAYPAWRVESHLEIRDEFDRAVPLGVPGELVAVRGDDVVRCGELVRIGEHVEKRGTVAERLDVRVESDEPAPAVDPAKSTGTLTAVVRCFEAVLERAPVRPGDDFFRRGGSSLGATRLIAAIAEEFGTRITLREFLQQPSPAGIAELVDGARAPATPIALDPEAWDPRCVAVVGPSTELGHELTRRLQGVGVAVLRVTAGDDVTEAAKLASAVYAGPAISGRHRGRELALATAVAVARTSTCKPIHYLGLLDELPDSADAAPPELPFPDHCSARGREESALIAAAEVGVPVVLIRLACTETEAAQLVSALLPLRCDPDADGRVQHLGLDRAFTSGHDAHRRPRDDQRGPQL